MTNPCIHSESDHLLKVHAQRRTTERKQIRKPRRNQRRQPPDETTGPKKARKKIVNILVDDTKWMKFGIVALMGLGKSPRKSTVTL